MLTSFITTFGLVVSIVILAVLTQRMRSRTEKSSDAVAPDDSASTAPSRTSFSLKENLIGATMMVTAAIALLAIIVSLFTSFSLWEWASSNLILATCQVTLFIGLIYCVLAFIAEPSGFAPQVGAVVVVIAAITGATSIIAGTSKMERFWLWVTDSGTWNQLLKVSQTDNNDAAATATLVCIVLLIGAGLIYLIEKKGGK
jgi:hypothetical protein